MLLSKAAMRGSSVSEYVLSLIHKDHTSFDDTASLLTKLGIYGFESISDCSLTDETPYGDVRKIKTDAGLFVIQILYLTDGVYALLLSAPEGVIVPFDRHIPQRLGEA